MLRLLPLALLLGACGSPPSTTETPPPILPGTTESGTASLPLTGAHDLARGTRYESGAHALVFQSDGNLAVVARDGREVWSLAASGVDTRRIARVSLQADGNLAAYDASGAWVWSALHRAPDPTAQLQLTSGGVLQLASGARGVLWSSDGAVTEAPIGPSPEACAPAPGWPQCRAVASPEISVYGTADASPAVLDRVAEIYAAITARLGPGHPPARMDGYRVYLTAGEPWAELRGLSPIGPMMGVDASGAERGDELRGGTSPDYLWITEQMVCTRGVETRNQAHREGRRDRPDNEPRAYDQVVHEFAHALDFRYGLRDRIVGLYTPQEAAAFPPEERFAWAVQHWFSTPRGSLLDGERQLLSELFSGTATFACPGR